MKNFSPTLVFRDFKRHYHKAREVFNKLSGQDPFELKINLSENKLQAEYSFPQTGEAVSFIVLMRRFLNPSDPLFYNTIWSYLKTNFEAIIPGESKEHIETLIASLNKGHIGININGENLTAEKIYQTISSGEYFHDDENARKYLQSLASVPFVGPLFWQQFHSYTLSGFALVYSIFDTILQIEKNKDFQDIYKEETLTNAKCIYCLSTSAKFSSEEHVFPESLGNDEMVLPKGYVCDKCNNGILAILDNSLLRFEPVAMLQVQFVPYTKDGKLPKANFQNMLMERTGPRNIRIKAKDRTGQIKNKIHLGDGWFSFSFDMKGKRFDPKTIGRALYKIALGTVALSQGREKASSARYDAARNFILNGQDSENNLLIRMQSQPHPQVRITYIDLQEGTPFAIDIYGLIFLINLENAPLLELNETLVQNQFAVFPLSSSSGNPK